MFRQPGALCVHVAEDPDKAWSLMAPFAMHEMNSYGEWTAETPGASTFQPISDPDALREHGLYRVLTPDECVAYGNALADHELLVLHPLVGGLTPDEGWASLELFATKVLPQLRRVSGPLWGASGP